MKEHLEQFGISRARIYKTVTPTNFFVGEFPVFLFLFFW